MHRLRNVVVLAAVAALLIGLATWLRRAPVDDDAESGPLLAALAARVNDIAQIRVTGPDQAFTVARTAHGWTVTDRDGYPAQSDTVRSTLLGIARMERLEAKTSLPEQYPRLQVEDTGQPDAKSVLFELQSADGTRLAAVLLGKERTVSGDPDRRQYYVRLAGEAQSWLVQTDLAPDPSLIRWLQQPVLEIDEARIRQVTVVHPDGETVTVRRPQPESADFVLSAVPEGSKVRYQFAVNDVAKAFASLRLDDVRRADSVDFSGAIRAAMETDDGLQVSMDVAAADGGQWVRLTAAADPSAARAAPDNASEAGAPDASDDLREAAAADRGVDPEQEAATLDARWRGWAYRLDEGDLAKIVKPLSELVEDVPAPEPPSTATDTPAQ